MFDLHPYFVALAYGLSALILVLEQIALRHRRRKALALVLRDRDLECETDLAN
jgi:heme exporter protein D